MGGYVEGHNHEQLTVIEIHQGNETTEFWNFFGGDKTVAIIERSGYDIDYNNSQFPMSLGNNRNNWTDTTKISSEDNNPPQDNINSNWSSSSSAQDNSHNRVDTIL